MKLHQHTSIILSSERLRLRLLEEHDALALFRLYSDAEVMRYWNHEAWANIGQAETAVQNARAEYLSGTSFHCVIEELASRSVVGSCALYDFDTQKNCASLGYLLSPQRWGKGYLLEAMGEFLNHAFVGLKLGSVCAQIIPENIASARLLGKLGFVSQCSYSQTWLVRGKPCRTRLYLLRRDQWQDGNQKYQSDAGSGRSMGR